MKLKNNRNSGWCLYASNPSMEETAYWESVMTLGNGFLGVRAAREEGGKNVRALTQMAEIYDRPPRTPLLPEGATPSMRLAPVTPPFEIDFDDGHGLISVGKGKIIAESFRLDMRHGLLWRDLRWQSSGGRITRINSCRFVNQARPHNAAINYTVTAENYSGEIRLISWLNATPAHPDGVVQSKVHKTHHDKEITAVEAKTTQSGHLIVAAARHRIKEVDKGATAVVVTQKFKSKLKWEARLKIKAGTPLSLEKIVVYQNSLLTPAPLQEALAEVKDLPDFAILDKEQRATWRNYWQNCDIEIKGDLYAQTMVRFWMFHLLQAASLNNIKLGLSASIPAKAMSGWGYGGRIFWDTEIYMLPFFASQFPDIGHSLLKYRYDRIPAARQIANRAGHKGLKFPWESADSGAEECPSWCPLRDGSGWERWLGGPQQIHINADVAYACHQFWLTTGDHDFWLSKGLEILFGTARYWASRVQPVKTLGDTTFEIRKVIGPDEGHASINNNLYTNAMAAWNLRTAAKEARQLLKDKNTSNEQRRRFKISVSECSQWEKVATGLKLNYDPQRKLYEQFDGYFKHPNPRIKQSDVLLALYLLPELQCRGNWKTNFKYYYPLTDHGSSLSPGLHVLFALLAGDMEMAYKFFNQACDIDGVYAPGQSDKGIHAAACGAGWLATIRGFGGVSIDRDGNLQIVPKMPPHWQKLKFAFWHQRRRLRVEIENKRVNVTAEYAEQSLKFVLVDKPVNIKAKQTLTARFQSSER